MGFWSLFMDNQNETKKYKLLFVKLIHVLVSAALFYVAWLYFRYGSLKNLSQTGFRYNYYIVILYMLLLYWFNRTYNSRIWFCR